MAGIFPAGLVKTKSVEQAALATNLAQAKIEEIISSSYADVAVGTTTEASLAALGSDFAPFQRLSAVNYLDSGLKTAAADQGLKKVKVRLLWFDAAKKATATLDLITILTDN